MHHLNMSKEFLVHSGISWQVWPALGFMAPSGGGLDRAVCLGMPTHNGTPVGSNLLLVRQGKGGPLVRQLPKSAQQLNAQKNTGYRTGCPSTSG